MTARALKLASERRSSSQSGWKRLYLFGGLATLISVLVVPVQIAVFFSSPPPDTAAVWLALFNQNQSLGLLTFEFLFVVDAVLAVPTGIAVYVALRETNPPLMVIALVLGLVGSVTMIFARPAFEMLQISERYAAATTDVQRMLLLSAGEATLATFNGTAFTASFNIGNLVLILVPSVMLQGVIFDRATAFSGLLAGITGFGIYLPAAGLYLGILSALLLAVYEILVGVRLVKLSVVS